ncbi:MAG TPA: sigma-70 family RNA polymerase sigma factor [Acidimicrobiales bacterium]
MNQLTVGEAELAERARQGDSDAWAEVCRAATPGLRASARRHVANADDADDVVSEVFARAFVAIPRYRADRPLVAWLHGIQRNVLREQARRRVPVPIGLDLSTAERGDGANDAEDPAACAVRAIDGALAVAALRTLDERARRIVYLRVCDGRSSDEVATLVHTAPAAVRMVQSRAVRRLREALAANA